MTFIHNYTGIIISSQSVSLLLHDLLKEIKQQMSPKPREPKNDTNNQISKQKNGSNIDNDSKSRPNFII